MIPVWKEALCNQSNPLLVNSRLNWLLHLA
jgi:hypothetical protein